MASPPIVEIAPRGDVVLVCGNGDSTKLRVESRILALASPVFQAMFEQQNLREGRDLAANGLIEVPLPDDDPVPLTTVCRILHMRFNVTEERIGAKEMVDIGVVADKYDCCAALSTATYYWCSKLIGVVDDMDRVRLFVAVYLLKNEEYFQKLSYDMVMKTSTDVSSVSKDSNCPEHLRDAFEALDQQRAKLCEDIERQLGDRIRTECNGACKCRLQRGASFVAELSNTSSLWPFFKLRKRRLEDICAGLRKALSSWSEWTPCQTKGSYCAHHNYPGIQEVKRSLLDVAGQTEGAALRLCLVCVRQGDLQQYSKCEKGHST